jgi:hypothetical protein
VPRPPVTPVGGLNGAKALHPGAAGSLACVRWAWSTFRERRWSTLGERQHVVQPGIKKTTLSVPMGEVLGATSDHLRRAGCGPLRVICS